MTALLYTSFLLFAAYIAVIIAVNGGVPASISDSFYILNRKKPGLGRLFTLWCDAVGISVMAVMFEFSDGAWFQFLSFFAGTGLCFAGTAPLFKSHEKVIHYASAAVCAVGAAFWTGLMGCYWLLPFIIPAPFANRGTRMFWTEMALFVIAYGALFIIHYAQ
jgi:hypothetical protein